MEDLTLVPLQDLNLLTRLHIPDADTVINTRNIQTLIAASRGKNVIAIRCEGYFVNVVDDINGWSPRVN